MVWKMESEVWYLNINFPVGHASPTGYLSPMLFFWGLIYSRHPHITDLQFVKFQFWISLWVTFKIFCLFFFYPCCLYLRLNSFLTFALNGLLSSPFQHDGMKLAAGLQMSVTAFWIPPSQLNYLMLSQTFSTLSMYWIMCTHSLLLPAWSPPWTHCIAVGPHTSFCNAGWYIS